MEKTTFFRKENWLNIFYLDINNRALRVDSIVLYNESGKLVEILDLTPMGDNLLNFNGKTFLKRKVDFTKKINFVISSNKDSWGETRYILYIYEKNVEWEKAGFSKCVDYIYRKYIINGIEFETFIKSIGEKSQQYRNQLEKELKKIDIFNFPMNTEELENICNELKEYNRLYLEEQRKIKEYTPTEKDFE